MHEWALSLEDPLSSHFHFQDPHVQMVLEPYPLLVLSKKHLSVATSIPTSFMEFSLINKLVNSNMQEGQSSTKFFDTWHVLVEVLISALAIPEQL